MDANFTSFIESQRFLDSQNALNLNYLEQSKDIDQQHTEVLKQHYAEQIESIKNVRKFKQSKYSTFQRVDETAMIRKKSQIPFFQNELKTQLLFQPLANDVYRDVTQHYDLPQFFQSILENLKLLLSRTKGQSLNVRKIQEYKQDIARIDLIQQDKPYIMTFHNTDFKIIYNEKNKKLIDDYIAKNNENTKDYEKMGFFRAVINSLGVQEMETLLDKHISSMEKSNESGKSDPLMEKLAIHEMNKCFYNDQHVSKAYIFSNCLNRLLQGDFNFIQLLQIEDQNTPLILNPCILGTKHYFEERLNDQRGDGTKKIYQKPSNLPTILFINLDGFDNPLNLEIIKRFTTFNYFSIFQEFLNPEGQFSFYNYLKQRSETLKSFFPFFLPFYQHIKEYYEEQGNLFNFKNGIYISNNMCAELKRNVWAIWFIIELKKREAVLQIIEAKQEEKFILEVHSLKSEIKENWKKHFLKAIYTQLSLSKESKNSIKSSQLNACSSTFPKTHTHNLIQYISQIYLFYKSIQYKQSIFHIIFLLLTLLILNFNNIHSRQVKVQSTRGSRKNK